MLNAGQDIFPQFTDGHDKDGHAGQLGIAGNAAGVGHVTVEQVTLLQKVFCKTEDFKSPL